MCGTQSMSNSKWEGTLGAGYAVHGMQREIISLIPESKGAFVWDYSGVGLFRIDGIRALLGAIPFSE